MKQFLKNILTLATRPRILPLYLRWLLALKGTSVARLSVLGASIGGFPSFSSYLGAVSGAPTKDEIAYMQSRLSGAKIIFDVGANFGAFAIPMANLAPASRIFAFEPHPLTAAALRENLIFNNVENVIVVEAAVADFDGKLNFSDSSDPATNKIAVGEEESVEVAARTIGSVCEEYGINQIDFLKIDVEGAELSVLNGARSLFDERKITAGMIEICPKNLSVFGLSIDDLVNFFEVVGFNLTLIGSLRGRPIDVNLTLENAFFEPKDLHPR